VWLNLKIGTKMRNYVSKIKTMFVLEKLFLIKTWGKRRKIKTIHVQYAGTQQIHVYL
jgi:hypothetical protein